MGTPIVAAEFELGSVVATSGVSQSLSRAVILSLVQRHASGDYGDISEHGVQQNLSAITEGLRVFSSYKMDGGDTVFVITEADRSATTVMFSYEY